MNIMLISQCSKNALVETRRILDQFAERRGERTWQTAITQNGLDTLRRLLRQTARKNTAVACHWIRGKDHSELIWIVGDARQFNERGATPTNTTSRDILRANDENDWHSAEVIRLLASIAALFHDFGKASEAFQAKLKSSKPLADAYRHEWVSLRLFEAFVNGDDDADWLARLVDLPDGAAKEVESRLLKDGLSISNIKTPFATLPPLAQVVGWLIVSHHRMPTPETLHHKALVHLPANIEANWCGAREGVSQKEIAACWHFPKGLPLTSKHWRKHAGRVASALLQQLEREPRDWRREAYVLHLSRMALMLSDHYYSSEPSHERYGDKVGKKDAVYANTDRKTGQLKQRLDEHLIGVEVNASRVVRTLPRLAAQLPRLARHKGFRERSKDAFAWQNRAFDLAEGLRARSAEQGFFGINMASTGCGKTLANGRILYALADSGRGARFTVALGLRTLTLQTGDAYRDRLRLGSDEMAVLVGGAAVRALHEQQQAEARLQAKGSESSAELLPEYNQVFYDGSLEDGPLNRWLGENQPASKLLNAPILVCTIDHLMPATEGTRGGHQIPPMLRLMSSDLVLDEPDDFGMEDLPALSRLVHWAGMLGSRVLLSSATLPPALIEGLFQAYLAGRQQFQQHRGRPGQPLNVCCAWFDEFSAVASEHGAAETYRAEHQNFVQKRLARLVRADARRHAEILPLPIAQAKREIVCAELAQALRPQMSRLHQLNGTVDLASGKKISFGLVRFANINPLVAVARELIRLGAENDQRIHLCVYHSRHPLLVRSAIENRLDRLLNRKQPQAVFAAPEIQQALAAGPEADHLFIVLATAVAEVGRDHDYDWAIVEPSSMRSIIQLAGRVRRHRPEAYTPTNLLLLDANIQHLTTGMSQPAFLRPGFESSNPAAKNFRLLSHRLAELLTPEQLKNIDASSRIRERDALNPTGNLVDLEHARLCELMQAAASGQTPLSLPVPLWWTTGAHLSGYLQRRDPFRQDKLGRQRYGLLPDEDGEIGFYRFGDDGKPVAVDHLLHRVFLEPGSGVSFWGEEDYAAALASLAERRDMELRECAEKFGGLDLPLKSVEDGQRVDEEWGYHAVLGLWREK
ncbi:type I-F CRISPR-associated helicase Cas3f [Azonexus sp. R2A61]|uniref:type I-F CRISPR-associated helicase Cas3f n=1 Tax=Azonexus sp. R2A61 TaxID=2744443 RepID=UPI001F2AB952|nr:type I-F CRISPR-associated helicase Cas3f [Azonexus sp. R2A61]